MKSIWQWNRAKEEIQNTLGDDVFVPRIMFMEIDGTINSVVAWTDAIPTVIPQVDALVILRQELASRRLPKDEFETCVTPFGKALNILQPFRSSDYPVPAFILSYRRPPQGVLAFVKNLRPHRGEMQLVPNDQVLDEELTKRNRKD